MCADICIHDPQKEPPNPHAHVMLTMRPIDKDGTWGAKSKTVNGRKVNTVDWNDLNKAEEWRRAWAAYANGAMRLAGTLSDGNVLDHRSYERQGIDQIPTVHLGVAAWQMEQKGIATSRGDKNREIEKLNATIRQSKARIRKLQNWLNTERENTTPTLADVFEEILKPDIHRTQSQIIYNIKLAAKALVFIQQNNIKDLADMNAVLTKMKERNNELRAEAAKVSRRLPTLTKNLKLADDYMKNDAVYRRWRGMKEGTPAEKKYYEKHKDEITAWSDAYRYFNSFVKGRKLPIADWKKELADITAKQTLLQAESQNLTAELKNAEAIKRYAERLMGVETPKRNRDIGRD